MIIILVRVEWKHLLFHDFLCFTRNPSFGKGGALCFGGTFQLTHCTFESNAAMDKGGAVFALGFPGGLIKSCTFLNNTAQGGGAVYCQDGHHHVFMLEYCTFGKNEATVSGGALYLNATSTAILNSKLHENMCPLPGTLFFWGTHSTLQIANSTIWKNNYGAEQNKFGVAVWIPSSKQFVAMNTAFHDNKGGVLLLGEARAEIHNCYLYGNTGGEGAVVAQESAAFVVV